jgi:hypothetical protein
MRRSMISLFALGAALSLQGCLAAMAVGTAVAVTGEVVEGAANVAVNTVEFGVDKVTESEEERDEKAEKKARKRDN